ncbi:MAG TPA: RdgB/HAM1 family non-canonical purine NTP pyrophosphatase [Chthoniobacterales bacterium]|jgi:XTP/dITP diphosphohydrolase|nr:RdgB/HAM1 family non-canonical purine NTP pyrophosphatase [Chthoniobacterales bacterium]
MDLLLATRNPHKTREFRELLGKNFKLIDLTALPEIAIPEETGRTFEENATLKAIAASKKLPSLVVADDSGLEVDALEGAPGIFSARYANENANAEENISKLLRELSTRNVAAEKRSARFRCVIALTRAGKLLGIFEGVVEGSIVDPARGAGGFGYDPVFQPTEFERTFAEMPPELKNKISHRAQAIAALREGLRDIAN